LLRDELARGDAASTAAAVEIWQRIEAPVLADDPPAIDRLADVLESACNTGRLALAPVPAVRVSPAEARIVDLADLAEVAPAQPPAQEHEDESPATTWFEVVVVDDLGGPLAGLELVFDTSDGSQTVVTDGSGKARRDGALGQQAAVRFASVQAVRDTVFPLWEQPRQGERPSGPDVVEVLVRDPIAALAIPEQQPTTLVLVPNVVRVRLTGMYFDNAKAFLLPDAMSSMQKLRELYDELPEARFLVVGHTNTVGEPAYNDRLSLERAASIAAFLRDRVDDWYAWYGADKSWEKRWGAPEDRYMLEALPHGGEPYWQGSMWASCKRFQQANGLAVTGVADEATRRALIAEYMAQDRTSLPESVEVTTHGCGEHFPEVAPGEDAHNRRVEIFVFDGPITPPPEGELSGPGATDYPAWRALTIRTFDFSSGATTVLTGSIWIRLELAADDAGTTTDKLVLRATDGYEQSHVIASDHVVADDEAVDVEFTDAPVDGVFTLTIEPSEGDPYELFADVPFAALGVLGIGPRDEEVANDDTPPEAAIAGIDQPAAAIA
ncbi:MAG TPA: OmpA family protein, partial [Nannocystaceae bacterium]|nr:OmpA family protein [Nannocystaceae bacterium]